MYDYGHSFSSFILIIHSLRIVHRQTSQPRWRQQAAGVCRMSIACYVTWSVVAHRLCHSPHHRNRRCSTRSNHCHNMHDGHWPQSYYRCCCLRRTAPLSHCSQCSRRDCLLPDLPADRGHDQQRADDPAVTPCLLFQSPTRPGAPRRVFNHTGNP